MAETPHGLLVSWAGVPGLEFRLCSWMIPGSSRFLLRIPTRGCSWNLKWCLTLHNYHPFRCLDWVPGNWLCSGLALTLLHASEEWTSTYKLSLYLSLFQSVCLPFKWIKSILKQKVNFKSHDEGFTEYLKNNLQFFLAGLIK